MRARHAVGETEWWVSLIIVFFLFALKFRECLIGGRGRRIMREDDTRGRHARGNAHELGEQRMRFASFSMIDGTHAGGAARDK